MWVYLNLHSSLHEKFETKDSKREIRNLIDRARNRGHDHVCDRSVNSKFENSISDVRVKHLFTPLSKFYSFLDRQPSHTIAYTCNSHHDTVPKTNDAIIGKLPSGSLSVYYVRCSEFADTANATPIAAADMVPRQSFRKSNSNCRFSNSLFQQVPGWCPIVKRN